MNSLVLLLSFLFISILFGRAVQVVREDQRVAVFRRGRYHRILNPGIGFLIPFIETPLRINLDQSIPRWRMLSSNYVDKAVREYIHSTESEDKYRRNLQESLIETFKKIITFMKPDHDLGIKNVHLRGLIRLIAGIVLTASFVFIAGSGFSLYDKLDIPDLGLGEDDILFIILFGIPWLLAVFSSAQLLWGLVELTMEKSWNEISSTTRLLLMVFIGMPLGIIVIAGIFYIAIWGS